jgi:hypothetical protein
MLDISYVGVFNSDHFCYFRGFQPAGMVFYHSDFARLQTHLPVTESEGSVPCSQEPVMGFCPVPHESSPHFITIYFSIILPSVPRSLNGSFNVVYTKYTSYSEQYRDKYTSELSCRMGTSCS